MMNKYVVIVIGIIVVIISALTILNTPSDTTILLPSPYAKDRASAVKVIADDLEFPTGVAVLPDKRIVITEQTGKALILNSNGSQLNNYHLCQGVKEKHQIVMCKLMKAFGNLCHKSLAQ